MPGAATPAVLAALAVLAVGATACDTGDGTTGGSGTSPAVRGTAPVALTPDGTLPAPRGATDLDGVRLRLRRIGEVSAPTALAARPGTASLYVTEQGGTLRRLAIDRQVAPDGHVVRADYHLDRAAAVDLTNGPAGVASGGERGLLGVTFSADGALVYLYYTDRDGRITVDEYRMAGDTVDAGSRRNLLSLEHPRPNHNGGQLTLGPDGFLYLGIGDGGGAGDPDGNGQNPRTLYGKILRIDPTRPADGRPYGIPAGNPFADGSQGAPEVWTFGLRNPWRFSFDRETRDLWVGDVGQDAWEEIDFLPDRPGGAGRGENLGWNLVEGSHAYRGGEAPAGAVPPLYEYGHGNGACSIVGGYVYRGQANPAWQGVYLWVDYCLGEIHTLVRGPDRSFVDRGTGVRAPDTEAGSGGSITSFGQDLDGELYALSAGGGLFKFEAD